jgi:hypothetical protein
MGNSRIIINTIEDTLVSTAVALPIEVGVVLTAPRGPIGIATKVTTETELLDKFGVPTSQFAVLDAVRSFLRLNGGITISRVKPSIDGVAASVNVKSTDASAVNIVKLVGKSFSEFENGFQLSLLPLTASTLNFVLRDVAGNLLETFTVPTFAPDFVSQTNFLSKYVNAEAFEASTTNLVASTKVAEVDTPLVFANGVAGRRFILNDVLNAVKVFESVSLGRLDIVAAPGLADIVDTNFGVAWATEIEYEVGDVVISSDQKYECIVAHESAIFADDLVQGNWKLTSELIKVTEALATITANRVETIALADFEPNAGVENVIAKATTLPFDSRLTLYHPGVKMRLSSGATIGVPAAMAALFVHAAASRINRWAAPAGFSPTFAIPNVSDFWVVLSQTEIDLLYNLGGESRPAINPIVYDSSVGWVIDGQRTTAEVDNIRRSLSVEKLIGEVKYQVNRVSKRYQYKPNNQSTWDSWRLDMTTYFNNILNLGGVSSFQVFMGQNTMTQEDIQNGRLIGLIKFVPTFTIEEIQITINVKLEV